MRKALLYFHSQAIVNYIAAHPVDWIDKDRHYAKIGGIGDQAGVTPTPAVEEFLSCLLERKALFTQKDYTQWCLRQWKEYIDGLHEKAKTSKHSYEELRKGVCAKLFRNFYPSMIDSLHAWALLVESGLFQRCYLDSADDAIGKTDITVVTFDDREFHIGLLSKSKSATECLVYKNTHRVTTPTPDMFHILLPLDTRQKHPGNKRWYIFDDFKPVFQAVAPETQHCKQLTWC